jgi:hypothetical protein
MGEQFHSELVDSLPDLPAAEKLQQKAEMFIDVMAGAADDQERSDARRPNYYRDYYGDEVYEVTFSETEAKPIIKKMTIAEWLSQQGKGTEHTGGES